MSDHPAGHQHHVDFEALCRQHHLACTDQRKLIWHFFAQQSHGQTVSEAVRALAQQGIGRATIYRTVELFKQLRLLIALHDADGKQRYGAICPGHAHALICQACHTVIEFDDCDLSVLEKLLTAKTGFAIDGHHLEVYGTCPACIGTFPG